MKTLELVKALKEVDLSEKIEIVINVSYGGFAVSEAVYDEIGIEWDGFGTKFEDDRSNPELIKAVRKLGDKSSIDKLEIIEVDIDDILTAFLENYDGLESVVYTSNPRTEPLLKKV